MDMKMASKFLRWYCKNCGRKCKAPRRYVGQTVECPGCGKKMKIPLSSTLPPPGVEESEVPKKTQQQSRKSKTQAGKALRIPCPSCRELTQVDAYTCPHCGKIARFGKALNLRVGIGAGLGTMVGGLAFIIYLESLSEAEAAAFAVGSLCCCGMPLAIYLILFLGGGLAAGMIIGSLFSVLQKSAILENLRMEAAKEY